MGFALDVKRNTTEPGAASHVICVRTANATGIHAKMDAFQDIMRRKSVTQNLCANLAKTIVKTVLNLVIVFNV